MRGRGLLVLLGLLTVVWSGVLRAGFIWDDHALVLGNLTLREPTFGRIFLSDLWCCTGGPTSPYYRPLTTLSLLLDHQLFGASAWGYHLDSLVLHLTACTFTWALARPALGERRALLAAAIFGLHPIQSEAVTWLAARNDLLATVAVLATLWALDDKPREGAVGPGVEPPGLPRLLLVGGLALVACLAKESSALLPALAWIWRQRSGRGLAAREVVALAVPVALAALAHLQIDWTPSFGGSETRPTSVAHALAALVTFTGWLSIPWPLTSTTTFFSTPPSPLSYLGCVCTCAGAAWLWRSGQRWALVWAILAFAPSVAGLWAYGLLGERYLYLPMFALAVGVAAAFPAAFPAAVSSTALARFVGGALALASIALLSFRLPDWEDDVVFFEAASRRLPNSYTLSLYGKALEDAGNPAVALASYDRALGEARRSLYGCTRVIGLAAGHVAPETLESAVDRWASAGCGAVPGFDDAAAMALLRAHRPAAAHRRVEARGEADGSGRTTLVNATIRLADGDLLGAAGLGLEWPGGGAAFREQLALLAGGLAPR